MECEYCGKYLGDRPGKFYVGHRVDGCKITMICDSQKCADALAYFLLGVATDKELQEKISKIIS